MNGDENTNPAHCIGTNKLQVTVVRKSDDALKQSENKLVVETEYNTIHAHGKGAKGK